MNSYDFNKAVSVLDFFQQELNVLISQLTKYEETQYGEKSLLQAEIKQQFKYVKDELKKQIKVLIEFDANALVVEYLLPPLCVASTHFQDIGINRINPNSIHKVRQLALKANGFIHKYHSQLENDQLG
ncbi:hypothetical protein ABN702_08280 [Bacillus haimaensis]|uniref:hypothetical protein n=1 Tax=Bacillus haimaensis TaxID=3160967 RepID=UPI003AA9617E